MKAHEVDKRFDTSEDISKYIETTKAEWSGQKHKKVNMESFHLYINEYKKQVNKAKPGLLGEVRQTDPANGSHEDSP